MKVLLLFVFLSAFFQTNVYAEYRVFVLKISKPNPEKDQPPVSRTVQSTLDPIQYKELYPVQPEEKIEYIDTWRCKGRTGDFQDFCPKPEASPNKAQIPTTPVSNQNGT